MNTTNSIVKVKKKKLISTTQLIISFLFLAILVVSSNAMAQTFVAELERSTITLGETVTLRITLPASGNAKPDISVLKKDFDILNTGQSNQVQIINGHRTDKKQLIITLRPNHYGNIQIPALKMGNYKTNALQLTVKDIPLVSSTDNGKSLWIEMDTLLKENQRNVMVQQEVPITVKVFTSLPLRNISISKPAPENALIEQLGDNVQYTTRRNGQEYNIVEQHYTLYPEQPGELIIPPVVLNASIPDPNQQKRKSVFGNDLFNDPFFKNAFAGNSQVQKMLNDSSMLFGRRGKSISVRSDGLKLNVNHIPIEAKGKAWLPARKVTLSSSWQNNPPKLISGEPVSLILTVKAEGLNSANIPTLHLEDKKGSYRVYEEHGQMKNLTDGQKVIGVSQQTLTLIPEQAGSIEIPAIQQAWWNTETQQMQTAEIPAIKLNVTQGDVNSNKSLVANSASNSTLSDITSSDTKVSDDNTAIDDSLNIMTMAETQSFMQIMKRMLQTYWLPVGLILLIIIAFYTRKKYTHKDSVNSYSQTLQEINNGQNKQLLQSSLKEAISACKTGNANQASCSILQWAKLEWPELAVFSLLDIADNIKYGDKNIRQLHHYMYQDSIKDETWSDPELAKLLDKGLQCITSNKKTTNNQVLPPLYPA